MRQIATPVVLPDFTNLHTIIDVMVVIEIETIVQTDIRIYRVDKILRLPYKRNMKSSCYDKIF